MNKNLLEKLKKIVNTKESNQKFDKKDIKENKIQATLSYIIPIIPYFLIKDSKWVEYHSKQGMNLMIIYIIFSLFSNILSNNIKINGSCNGLIFSNGFTCLITPWWITFPIKIIELLFLSLSLIGILNVITKKARPLPLIEKINIVK